MKKIFWMGTALFMVFAMSSCKSKESAYKKAYEKAKAQQTATTAPVTQQTTPVSVTPVTTTTTPTTTTADYSNVSVRTENVTLVSGAPLKAYSVVVGSFGVKANAEGLKAKLDADGYSAKVVYNAERNMYRVVAASYDDRMQAAQARDDFKAKHPNNADFQKAWLLYNVK